MLDIKMDVSSSNEKIHFMTFTEDNRVSLILQHNDKNKIEILLSKEQAHNLKNDLSRISGRTYNIKKLEG